MRMLASWGAFALAIGSFSHIWQGVRAVLEGQRLYGPLEGTMWMALFLGSMGYLACVIYAADRAAGRAKRGIRLFDWILDRGDPRVGREVPGRP